MKKNSSVVALVLLFLSVGNCFVGYTQQKQKAQTDSNTPLHLLAPDYKIPYAVIDVQSVKTSLDKVLNYLDKTTPTYLVDNQSGKKLDSYESINKETRIAQGDYRLTSYEWGVTYSGMLAVSEVTKDKAYFNYVLNRLEFLSEIAPHFKQVAEKDGVYEPQMRQVLHPQALDDAGAVCASMIKYELIQGKNSLKPLIDNYINYICYKEHRLSDGTFARHRPQRNTLWLDDMYMSIPALAQMSRLAKDQKYLNEAVKQVVQFAEKMFVPEKKMFRHGWVESMTTHPSFFWGRANGWAMLTMVEVLDVLPQSHPKRNYILDLLRMHIEGITAYQSGDGFWHQLVDRNDSYYETSATAIFTYCIARAVNRGWVDSKAYGPIACLGWNAVQSKIEKDGKVDGTCVGTGMAFDPAFYYYRPISVYAAHSYGPVLLAGAEIIRLVEKQHPKLNDNAIQFYETKQENPNPIFYILDPSRPADVYPGSSRVNNYPIVFLIGDSTVKNGKGEGDGDQWGWGSLFSKLFDTEKISVENHALGGRSSRTFYTEGLWDKTLGGIKKGDYLFIQFGHNDGGPLNTGRARASLKGIGNESEKVIMERNGSTEEVFTYGHYLRIYIRQAKARGANPIVLSPTPGNRWTNGKVNRMTETYTKWAKQVAEQEDVLFIDLNALSADVLDSLGEDKGKGYFLDSVHTNYEGAMLNAKSIIKGLLVHPKYSLVPYINLNWEGK